MNICFVENFSETDPGKFIAELVKMGHTVSPKCDEKTDVIFCASIVKMDSAASLKSHYNIPLVNYCWDFYLWAYEGKHDLPWRRYASYLRKSSLVMVPSSAQQKRLKEMIDVDSVVVKTSIPVYDEVPSDGRYVLDPVRYYEHDPNCYWVRDACAELDIPFIHSEHQYSVEEFRKIVANATLLTCGYVEASTGGLSLMEGLWLGKPSLVSNSPYMGASDYLGSFGNYFQYDSYEDLKVKLRTLFDTPPKINVELAKEYISKYFSPEAMASQVASQIERLLCELKKN
jgi:hypothetical protein